MKKWQELIIRQKCGHKVKICQPRITKEDITREQAQLCPTCKEATK